MFQYEVLSEAEAMQERFHLLKEGIYDAVVTASVDTRSSNSGNPMMDMTVTVYDENGKGHEVRDFLVFTKMMMWRVIHFAESAGLLKVYEEGKLCSETVINSRVKVKIIVEPGSEIPEDKLKGKPLGTKYFDKNKIEDYIKKEEGSSKECAASKEFFEDDKIPF